MKRLAYWLVVSARNLARYGRAGLFTSVAIETSSWCNRRCEYCPNKTNKREKRLLDIAVINGILDQLGEIRFDGTVYFHLYNEPLLDMRLPGIISYARSRCPGATLKLSSNGDFLNLESARGLIHAGMDAMLVTQYDGKINENVSEVLDLLPFTDRKRIIVRVRNKFDNNRGGAVEAIRPGTRLTAPCYRPGRMLVINYMAKVVVCCNDYFGREDMGDASKERLLDIWFGGKFGQYRKALNNGVRGISSLCTLCNEALPMEDSVSDLSRTRIYGGLKKAGIIR